jgi:hypothetical protein
MALCGAKRATDPQPRFPAMSFGSYADYRALSERTRMLTDERLRQEQAMAVPPGEHHRRGTCAPCLRQARFSISTEGGDALGGGMVVPKWPDQLVCDCADRLPNRHRALLHFVQAVVQPAAWHRVLAFGPLDDAYRRVCARIGETTIVPALSAGPGDVPRIAAPSGRAELAICIDHLHRIGPMTTALGELHRTLAPGGMLVFTVPFRWDRLTTRAASASPGGVEASVRAAESHLVGWDILDRLRDAGFVRSRVHVYWSTELGYLGLFNTIFSAET